MENTNIKSWYQGTFPTDELGSELNDTVTFGDLFTALDNHQDVSGTPFDGTGKFPLTLEIAIRKSG